MYKVVVVVLFKAGDHEPVILLSDVVGKGTGVAPEQIAATVSNVGSNNRIDRYRCCCSHHRDNHRLQQLV
jgi:hypothetical protein